MKRIVLVAVSLCMVVAVPGDAYGQGPGRDRGQRRAQLEARVRGQFMAEVARRLELSDAQRDGLAEVLREGAEARRALAGESRTLRMQLVRAARSESTPVSTFETLLEGLESLHERERQLAEQERERIAELLDPRQQAIFLLLRMQLNDRIRGMRGPGGGPGPGGPPLFP